MDEKKEFVFLPLEEKLIEDAEGRHKKEIEEELFQLLTDVKRHIDSGLPPDEFSQYNAFRQSIEATLSVLDKVWTQMHG
jgi:hypothetical protein